MKDASDSMVMHFYRYYGSYLPRHGHDANLVHGLFRRAADEALKRGLIFVDPKSNHYKEVENV